MRALSLLLAFAVVAMLCGAIPASGSSSHAKFRQGESLKSPSEFLADASPHAAQFRDMLAAHFRAKGKGKGKINLAQAPAGNYSVGVGIADVTGQVAEIGFMGYATPEQKGAGLQQRLRSRAFIFVDDHEDSKTSGKRVVYVSADICMGFQMMKTNILDKLRARFGDLYTDANVMLSGTHTHAAPGGIGGMALVDITTLGFIPENHWAAVDGIVKSIERAHDNIKPAVVKMNVGQCDNCNINRSPSAYLLDPDRAAYANDTDQEMTVLRVEGRDGTEMGLVSFFAVHGTSLNNNNSLVSGDNKGYASYVVEKQKNPPGTLPGEGAFVAAFGQSNEGDVSPNTRGAACPDGSPCDFVHSTCGDPARGQTCLATGPGVDQYDSMRIIGQRQVDAAMRLYNSASVPLSAAGVDYRFQYVDMESVEVSGKFTSTGRTEHTCPPALGYSFAAGTTDGCGAFDFVQGTTEGNPFWDWVSGFLSKPTAEQIACHAPKPILLNVGQVKPISWSSVILPEQVFRIGQLWILAVPGEFTTMAGRRLRGMTRQLLQAAGEWTDSSHIVIAGLANSYSHYITTYEEYQQQRYEGASTLYGPHTHAAHMQNFAGLVEALVAGQPVPEGPQPLDMRNHTMSFMPRIVEDTVPAGVSFGDVHTDVQPSYKIGQTVRVSFWGASPRNELFLESSFLFIEQLQSDGSWRRVLVDSDIETRFLWERVQDTQSRVTVEWDLEPQTTEPGTYRITHQGRWKKQPEILTPYWGESSTFTVEH